jgi:hypothetical protein
MEVISSSGTSAHIRTTRRYIPEDGNIQELLIFLNAETGLKTEHRFVCYWNALKF